MAKSTKSEKLEKNNIGNNENMPLIKSLKVFTRLLSNLCVIYQNNEELTLESLKNNINDIISEINIYENKIISDELLYYKSLLIDIIDDMNYEKDINANREKPLAFDTKPFSERATSKLLTIFSCNEILTEDEAKDKYNENYELVNNKFITFVSLIDWLNQNGLSVIPDRSMFASFLHITIECYENFLTVLDNEKIKNVFTKFEEYIISIRLNASELGTRNAVAIKTNVSYEKYGNGLSPKDSSPRTQNNILITNDEIFNKMKKLGYKANIKNNNIDNEY